MNLEAPGIDQVARLVGDPSRARMLDILMDGRAWTGRELAHAVHVTPSTASEHLQRLVNGGLLSVVQQGRFHYYRIASPEVAYALEALMVLVPRDAKAAPKRASIDPLLRRGRTCYDHLAGELGVAITESLIRRGAVTFGPDGGTLTPAGMDFFERLEVAIEPGNPRRPLCRPCMDWSERRLHLAGRAGTALARHTLERGWVQRQKGSRAVLVTETGAAALRDQFGVDKIAMLAL
jgi:DNA-binding transcriptional ArsR family regulator